MQNARQGKCRQVQASSAGKCNQVAHARQDKTWGHADAQNSTQSICTTPVCRRAGAGYQKMVLTEIPKRMREMIQLG